MTIWDCHGGNNQKWNVNANGTITNIRNELCLDANAARTANGTQIILWTRNGGGNQRWTLRWIDREPRSRGPGIRAAPNRGATQAGCQRPPSKDQAQDRISQLFIVTIMI